MQDPNFWNDREKVSEITNEIGSIKRYVTPWKELKTIINDTNDLLELALIEKDESIAEEINTSIEKIKKDFDNLEFLVLLNGEHDQTSSYIEINAGAGGTEACDWASMLYRMYMRWCDVQGLNTK